MARELPGKVSVEKRMRDRVRSMRSVKRVIEVAPGETHLTGEKSDERQTDPLGKAKWAGELFLGVAKSRLYGIRGGDRQTHTSVRWTARWRESTAKMARDQPTLSRGVSNEIVGRALHAQACEETFYTTVFTAERVFGSAELRTFS